MIYHMEEGNIDQWIFPINISHHWKIFKNHNDIIQTIIVLISKIANTKQEQIFISNTFPFIEKEKNCAQEKMLGVVR